MPWDVYQKLLSHGMGLSHSLSFLLVNYFVNGVPFSLSRDRCIKGANIDETKQLESYDSATLVVTIYNIIRSKLLTPQSTWEKYIDKNQFYIRRGRNYHLLKL
jgi:hypothetical protein